MLEIAPGSILQRMFLKERFKRINSSDVYFYEIGCGNGVLSNIMLELGWKGAGYDLNKSACENNIGLNEKFIGTENYSVHNSDFLQSHSVQKADVIISSMVIEHLDDEQVDQYFDKCISQLKPGGKIIVIVPGNMKFWGIEDEIAGHFKRYELPDFENLRKKHRLNIDKVCGLTYPVSNLLFGLSNYLVRKNESWKESLDQSEKTILSGNREVKLKTSYPDYFRFILNEITMWPFHLLQKVVGRSSNSMVLYCEMSKE